MGVHGHWFLGFCDGSKKIKRKLQWKPRKPPEKVFATMPPSKSDTRSEYWMTWIHERGDPRLDWNAQDCILQRCSGGNRRKCDRIPKKPIFLAQSAIGYQ